MGSIKFGTGLILTALFAVAIIGLATNFADSNDADISIVNDSEYTSINNKVTGNLSTFREDSEASSRALTNSSVTPGDEVTESGGQFKVGLVSSMAMTTNVVNIAYKKIFGKDGGFGIFLTALVSVLVWMIALYAWKAWKGSPD